MDNPLYETLKEAAAKALDKGIHPDSPEGRTVAYLESMGAKRSDPNYLDRFLAISFAAIKIDRINEGYGI